MTTPSKVTQILDDTLLELQSIAAFNGTSIHVLTEKDFFEKIAGVAVPCVGLVYEGMRSRAEGDKPTHRVGLNCDLNIAVILAMQNKLPFGGDLRGTAIEHLDTIRNKLKDTKTRAGGHYWRFLAEAPAMEKDKHTLWMQRWATVVQLT